MPIKINRIISARLAQLGVGHLEVKEALGWSSAAWYAKRNATNPSLSALQTMALILAVPTGVLVGALCTGDLLDLMTCPLPPEGWLVVVARHIEIDETVPEWETLKLSQVAPCTT